MEKIVIFTCRPCTVEKQRSVIKTILDIEKPTGLGFYKKQVMKILSSVF